MSFHQVGNVTCYTKILDETALGVEGGNAGNGIPYGAVDHRGVAIVVDDIDGLSLAEGFAQAGDGLLAFFFGNACKELFKGFCITRLMGIDSEVDNLVFKVVVPDKHLALFEQIA